MRAEEAGDGMDTKDWRSRMLFSSSSSSSSAPFSFSLFCFDSSLNANSAVYWVGF
jgi:hypothetical protein